MLKIPDTLGLLVGVERLALHSIDFERQLVHFFLGGQERLMIRVIRIGVLEKLLFYGVIQNRGQLTRG